MEDTYDIRENWEKKYLEITRIYGYVVLDRIIDLLYLLPVNIFNSWMIFHFFCWWKRNT